MSKDGIAALGRFKIDRSTKRLTTGRIHYSMFISFFLDLTGRSRAAAPLIGKRKKAGRREALAQFC
jgi:hypothetical protein